MARPKSQAIPISPDKPLWRAALYARLSREDGDKPESDSIANQRLLLHLRRQKQELERLRICDRKAKELVAHLAVLGHMEAPGRLSPENRKRLAACGAEIRDARQLDSVMEVDVVTNFHVGQILTLRRELLENLRRR